MRLQTVESCRLRLGLGSRTSVKLNFAAMAAHSRQLRFLTIGPEGGGKAVTRYQRYKQTAVFLFLAGLFFNPQGFALRAGAAKSSITPDVHAGKVYMAGFGFNRLATGVHDDLYARCLAIGAGGKTLVVCAADLIGLFHPEALRVHAKVEAQLPGVTQVIVASTHDHEGPDTLGLWGPALLKSGVNVQYLDWVVDRIADTAVRAARNMQEARM